MGAAAVQSTGTVRRSRPRSAARIRRRRLGALVSGMLGFALLVGLPISYASYNGSEMVVPGSEVARSFMALMKDRSPGERTAAELRKTKRAYAQAPKPRQRALGKVRNPAVPDEFIAALSPPPPPVLAEVLPKAPIGAPAIPGIIGPPGLSVSPPGGGIFVPPGGGGSSPPGGGTPPGQPPEQPPVPAVPEPSTWAMLLIGFGMTGWAMRRQRRLAMAVAAA